MSYSSLKKSSFAVLTACLLLQGVPRTSEAQMQEKYQMSITTSATSITLGQSFTLTAYACPGMYNSVYFYEGGYPGENMGTLIGNGYSQDSTLVVTPTTRGSFSYWAGGQAEYCTDEPSNVVYVTVK